MFITGLGTALPPKRYSQEACWRALERWDRVQQLAPRSRALLKRVLLGDNGITSRHFALEALEDGFVLTPDVLHARFAREAPNLAAAAGDQALKVAGVAAEQIDAVIVSTCTGYLCPGLTSYLAERLRLRADVAALDLVGQGCGAALPNLRTGAALLASGSARHVLCVCVEICSAAAYLDDDPGVLISACLFGDGAGAAVLSAEAVPGRRRVRWQAASTLLDASTRDLLRFEQRGGMLRNILTPEVPDIAARHAVTVLEEVLARAGQSRDRIRTWILHAGGRDVLAALRERLGLTEADTRRSADVLRTFGNLSSPFVLVVLQRALAEGAPGGNWWLASFGAGFSSHGALLEVE